MKIALTMMVRDEADIVAAMLEHHLRQGVDVFIITDNGSIDGTQEIIADFATRATVDLREDPEHRKQQGEVVTRMARDAKTVHGADWVINADADEFWFAADRSQTVRDALAQVPHDVQAFTAPVIDMIGAPATSGSGLGRLTLRDARPTDVLNLAGIFAHATPDAVHRADETVTVVQGNHFVNLPTVTDTPSDALHALEVLHLPWRSWDQFRRKVENAGRSYENNPDLKPSPNHHGMRDYRRLQHGTLLASYVLRHPSASQVAEGLSKGWYEEDLSVANEALPGIADVLVPERDLLAQRAIGTAARAAEDRMRAAEDERDVLRAVNNALAKELAIALEARRAAEAALQAQLDRRVVRMADSFRRTFGANERQP